MKSLNFVLLGDASIGIEFGKKGSSTDMTFYERKSSDKIFSFIAPTGFPEKIQSLVQSIALTEYVIVNVTKIDKALGEQIVALDSMKMEHGFIIPNGFEDDIRKIIKSTVLEKYEFVTLDEMKQKIETIEPVSLEGPAKILVDACFEVKGVGTVALGVVRRGTVRKHDELELFPQKKPVSVRSIQMHDNDVEETSSPGRVGIALKGTDAAEIPRGEVIAAKGSMKTGNEIKIKFEKAKFYRGEINPTSSYHLCVGLQIKPVKFDGASSVSEKLFAYDEGENCLVLDLNSESVRIVGSGTIL